jgi:hypothetical protein
MARLLLSIFFNFPQIFADLSFKICVNQRDQREIMSEQDELSDNLVSKYTIIR